MNPGGGKKEGRSDLRMGEKGWDKMDQEKNKEEEK